MGQAQWNETGIAAINFAGNLQHDGATFTALSGAHTFSGGTKTISGGSEISIPNVAVTGTYTNSGTLTISTALSGAGGLTNGNGTTGTLNLGGTNTVTTFTATPVGNTVNYTGTGQTLRVTAYHHLKLSGGAETFGAITTVAGNLTLSGAATATTGAGLTVSGNLSIGDGTIFTIAGFASTVAGITTVGGGTSGNLTISSATGAKLFTGLVTIASGATWNNSGNSPLEFRGGITTTPVFTGGTGLHTFTINAQALTGTFSIPSVTVTGITLTNNNSLTVATALEGTGGLTQASSANLLLGGTAGISTLTASASGNLVNYYGAAQTAKAATYYNLTLSGSLAKTFATTPTVNGTLSMEGTATAVVTSGAITYGGAATLQYKGTSSQTTGIEFPASWAGTGGVKIENANGVTLGAAKNIGAQPFYIGSIIPNSIFNDGGYQLTGTGTLNLTSGKFILGAATATTFPEFGTRNITDGTTVEYAATATQTVKGITYSNLTISGTGNNLKTADADITVNGILNLSSANASASQGCLSMSTYTLNMGVASTTTGTGDVTGIVKRAHTFANNTPYSFGNQFTTVTFIGISGGTKPGWLSCKITIGTAPTWKTGAINRVYTFAQDAAATDEVITNLHYLDGVELNSNTDTKLVFWDAHNGPDFLTVHEHGKTNHDETNNWVGLSGLTVTYIAPTSTLDNKQWTLANSAASKNTWQGSDVTNPTKWDVTANWSAGHVPLSTEDVLIPASKPHYPVLTLDVEVKTLELEAGASLDPASFNLTLNGYTDVLLNDGTLALGTATSTVIFSYGTISHIVAISGTGTNNFNNLEVKANTYLQPASGTYLKIAGTVTPGSGSIIDLKATNNTVEYNGGSQSIINLQGPASDIGYSNLVINSTGTTMLPAQLDVMRDFTLTDGTAAAAAASTINITGNVTLTAGTFTGSSSTINASGNWTNNGATFTPGTSTINFNNTSTAQAINGSTGSQTFNNINIDKGATTLSVGGGTTSLTVQDLTETSGNFTAPATLTVNGNTTITSGTFTAGTNTYLKGNWSNNGGTFVDNGGTVTFNSTSSAQTISGVNTFTNLTINNSYSGHGVTATASQTVNGVLNLLSANATSTAGCLDMTDPNVLFMGASATTTGTGDVSGYINRTSFALGTDYTFGNHNTKMNFTVGPLPSSVTLEVYLTNPSSWKPGAINRYYDITQTGGTTDTRLRFNAHYLNSELNGNTDGILDLFDHHYTGTYAGQTHDHGRTDFSNAVGAEWVGFSNVGLVFLGVATPDDHLWTLGNNVTGNTCTWLGGSPSGPTDWNLPGNWEGGVPLTTSNVVIPATTYSPLLPAGYTTILTMDIKPGAILNTTSGTPTLTVAGESGAWINEGTLEAGNSTVAFSGTAPTMSGSTIFNNITVSGSSTLSFITNNVMGINGTLTVTGHMNAASEPNTIIFYNSGQTITNPDGTPTGFYNLVVAGTGTTAGEALNAAGNFSITSTGALIAGSYTHTIKGNFTNDGSFTGTGSTLDFNNSAAFQSIGGTTATTFNNITINNPLGVTLTSSGLTTVNGDLLINSGDIFNIGAGKQLTVSGTLTNSSGNNGLVIKSDANGTGSLISNSLAVPAKVERYIINDFKWHFLSSPVAAQEIWPNFASTPDLSSPVGWVPAAELPYFSSDFYYFNPYCPTTGLMWVNLRYNDGTHLGTYNNRTIDDPSSAAGFGGLQTAIPQFDAGKGYVVAYDASWGGIHSFAGELNSGVVERGIVNYSGNNPAGSAFNLVGNPYPCSIDWKNNEGWSRNDLATHNITSGYDYWVWNDAYGNYGVFNSLGSSGTLDVSQYVAPMQSFFVKASTIGAGIKLKIYNGAKTHSSQAWLKTAFGDESHLTLNLTTDANPYSDEMIIGFSSDYGGWGSSKFWSMYTEAPEFYSVKDGEKYSIDRYNAFNADMTINISAKCGVDANYTITAPNIAAFSLSDRVILIDLKTGAKVDLKATGSYTFHGTPSDTRERFQLVFHYGVGIENNTAGKQIYAFTSGSDLFLNAAVSGVGMCDVVVYDAIGRVVFTGKYDASNGKQKVATLSVPGTYIAKVVSKTGATTTKVLVH